MKSEKEMAKRIVTIPNILSLLRLCLIPLIIWAYIGPQRDLWAGLLLILSGLTDVVDGFIARRFHMISDLGKVLDPIADKLTQLAVLICLLVRFPLVLLPLGVLLLKEGFMVISGYIIIRKKGIVLGACWHGKAATLLLYATMILHMFWYHIPLAVHIASVLLCTAMLILTAVLYGIRNLGMLLRKEENE